MIRAPVNAIYSQDIWRVSINHTASVPQLTPGFMEEFNQVYRNFRSVYHRYGQHPSVVLPVVPEDKTPYTFWVSGYLNKLLQITNTPLWKRYLELYCTIFGVRNDGSLRNLRGPICHRLASHFALTLYELMNRVIRASDRIAESIATFADPTQAVSTKFVTVYNYAIKTMYPELIGCTVSGDVLAIANCTEEYRLTLIVLLDKLKEPHVLNANIDALADELNALRNGIFPMTAKLFSWGRNAGYTTPNPDSCPNIYKFGTSHRGDVPPVIRSHVVGLIAEHYAKSRETFTIPDEVTSDIAASIYRMLDETDEPVELPI